MNKDIRILNEYFFDKNKAVCVFLHSYPEVIPLILVPFFLGADFLFFNASRSQSALFIFSISLFTNLILYLLINIGVGVFRRSTEWFLSFRYSFPSLHTQGAFSFVFVGCFFYRYFSIFFLLLAFVYGYSRIVLKVHTLGEVVWGAVLGCIVAVLCSSYLRQYSTPINTIIFGTALFMTMILLPIFDRRRGVKAIYK